ncbi:MAG TPA: ATP-binding protein [Longimicrobiales bacterium]|nr:ATP-binding protein [Longimicrobiales bacterium]
MKRPPSGILEITGGALLSDLQEQARGTAAELAHVNATLELLLEAAAGLLATDQPRRFVRTIFERLADHIGVDVYFNFLVAEHDGRARLHLDSCAGIPEDVERACEWLDLGAAVCGTVAQQRERMSVEDVQGHIDPMTDLIRTMGITAYACHPLMVGERLVGTLSFGFRGRTRFSDGELAVIKALCDQVAVAIDRWQAYEAERSARLEAERANDSKARFLAVMSHELRTPLTAIVGYSELLESHQAGALSDVQQSHVERIKAATWHLVGIVDEVLTHARTEAGREEVRVEPMDGGRLVAEVSSLFEESAASAGIALRVRVPPEPIPLETDAGKLRQILVNLVGNAVKFTERGEVEVTAASPDGLFVVTVRDTGVGIAPEDHERIFQPFTQADNGTTRTRQGTGLGLTVSRTLARLLGGELTLESEPGVGSTFQVRLPR